MSVKILARRLYPPLSKKAEDAIIIDCVERNGVWNSVTKGQKLLRSKCLKAGLLGAGALGLGLAVHARFKHGQTKTAGLQSFFGRMRQPGFLKNTIKRNAFPLAGIAAGTAGGLYLGNIAWNNAIPPVRQLPDFMQQPYLEANQPYYLQDEQTGGY